MGKLKNTLTSLILLATIATAGCSISLKTTPIDLSKTKYAPDIQKEAEELSESYNLKDLESSVRAWGSIGRLKEMDEQIKKIIDANIRRGLIYGQIGEEYHEHFKR